MHTKNQLPRLPGSALKVPVVAGGWVPTHYQVKHQLQLRLSWAVTKIPVKHCVKCNLLLYPQLYDVGLIPLHNKFLISFDYLLELSFLLDSGISMIEVIKNKVNLLCQREGLQFKPDHNTSSTIERFAVAINAVLITGISN